MGEIVVKFLSFWKVDSFDFSRILFQSEYVIVLKKTILLSVSSNALKKINKRMWIDFSPTPAGKDLSRSPCLATDFFLSLNHRFHDHTHS